MREATDRLVAQFGESAFVYVWAQSGPVLVHTRRPFYAVVAPRIGSVVPLVGSATGPVFVAYMPLDVVRPVLARDAAAASLDGATSIRFICLLAAPEGLAAFHADHPDVPVFTAAIDRGLDDHGYIRPGLGDAGDRLYGTR